MLSAVAHGLAGGALPSLWLLLLGAALLLPIAYLGTGREAFWPRIVIGLALAQGAFHVWLQFAAGAHHAHAGSIDIGRMLLAHAAATLVAAVWLRYGEQRVWAAARERWLSALLRGVGAPRLIVPRRAPRIPAARRAVVDHYLDIAPRVCGMRAPPMRPVLA